MPIAAMATSRSRSPMIIRWRRSIRSDRAPVAISSSTCGIVQAAPTSENTAGEASRSL